MYLVVLYNFKVLVSPDYNVLPSVITHERMLMLGQVILDKMASDFLNKPHELNLSDFFLVLVEVFSEDILDIELMKVYILCLALP